jgi:hypothetical protein
LAGRAADLDNAAQKATGLEALGEVDDIAIVALPDAATYADVTSCEAAARALIAHAEQLRYRIAVVDAPRNSSMTQVRRFRGQFDTRYGAMYHPWIEILDPLSRPAPGALPLRIMLPSSGFVAGIYARNDITRGVYKAPANEVVQGLTRFEVNINKARNDVLNPDGINALRFFEGRGNRVWGARTMSSDPEWMYVNVRRLFIYLEASIDYAHAEAMFDQQPRVGQHPAHRGGLPLRAVALRGAAGGHSRGGVLRALRPHHDDPERPRQRPAHLPDRRRADQARRVRHLPHRPVHGRGPHLTGAHDADTIFRRRA